MNRQQFLQLFVTKQYNLIAYNYHLEKGKTNLQYESFVEQVNILFHHLWEICIDVGSPLTYTWDDVVNEIVKNYFNQFSIITLVSPDGRIMGYM